MTPDKKSGFQGVLSGITPADVIQLHCLNIASTVITVDNGKDKGDIYIKSGQIIHAEIDEIKGEDAFFGMMNWITGSFSTSPLTEVPERTIERDWNYLIIEALRIYDENRKAESEDTEDTMSVENGSQPIKVMIVDDSAVMLSVIKKNLDIFPDIDIVGEAKSGEEALKVFSRTNVDVVLLDLTLPGMDGVEVLKRILISKPVPVLMMSALSEFNQDKVFEALKLGALDFIMKPKKEKNFSLSDHFLHMRSTIKEIAHIRCETIHKLTLPDLKQETEPDLPAENAEKLIIILSNISNFRKMLESVESLPHDLDKSGVLVYHPFPSQLHSGMKQILKHYNHHPIVSLGSNNDDSEDKGDTIKASTIYLLPPSSSMDIISDDNKFILSRSNGSHMEPKTVVKQLIEAINSNNLDYSVIDLLNGNKTFKIEEEKSKVIILNYSYPAIGEVKVT